MGLIQCSSDFGRSFNFCVSMRTLKWYGGMGYYCSSNLNFIMLFVVLSNDMFLNGDRESTSETWDVHQEYGRLTWLRPRCLRCMYCFQPKQQEFYGRCPNNPKLLLIAIVFVIFFNQASGSSSRVVPLMGHLVNATMASRDLLFNV